jgi:hypothetical protein
MTKTTIFARAGFVAALAAALAGPAAAVETSTVGIRPEIQQDWFKLDVLPGQTAHQTAVAINRTDTAVSVLVYAVDALTTPQGGFALHEKADARSGVGAWTRLGVDRLEIPARSNVRIPFTLSVPAATAPGDYAGGIVVEREPMQGASQDIANELAVKLNIVERVGVRIYLNVAGEAVRRLKAGRLTWSRSGGAIRFILPVTNTGNVTVRPRGRLRIRGRGTVPFDGPAELLPASKATMTAVWRDVPSFGQVNVTAVVEYGGKRPATKRTSFRVIPWRTVLIVAFVVAAIAGLGWRAVRLWRRARAALRALESVPPTAPRPDTTRAVRPHTTRRTRTRPAAGGDRDPLEAVLRELASAPASRRAALIRAARAHGQAGLARHVEIIEGLPLEVRAALFGTAPARRTRV